MDTWEVKLVKVPNSFVFSLAYSYLCHTKRENMDLIHIIAVVVLIVIGALIYRSKNQ